jgi:hypothetical protein
MGAPLRSLWLNEVPVFQSEDKPPSISALALLLDDLESGAIDEEHLLRLCLRPEALEGILPRDAAAAMERFVAMKSAAAERALVNVLAALSKRERRACVAYLSRATYRYLTANDIDTTLARRDAARLILG